MKFIENGVGGQPAMALVAIKSKEIYDGMGTGTKIKIDAGYIRAVRRVGILTSSENDARKELIKIVGSTGGKWQRYWRIAKGVMVDGNT